jgi:hypothetical protein
LSLVVFFFLMQNTNIKAPIIASKTSGPTTTPAIQAMLFFLGAGVGVGVGTGDEVTGGTVTVVEGAEGVEVVVAAARVRKHVSNTSLS